MKTLLLTAILSMATLSAFPQNRYFTKTGHIDFFSSTPIEDIKANNDQVTSFIDTATGEMVFSVLMRSFQFEKALMQEHFNENYVESAKFPKATFEGKLIDAGKVGWDKPGEYPVKVKGNLTLHGVTKEVEADGSLVIESGRITGKSQFLIKPADYKITIPQVVKNNIAEQIKVNVLMYYTPYQK